MESMNKYETTATVRKDLTAYGNKYYLQLEDTEINDNAEVDELVGKTMKVIILFSEED